MKKYRSDINNPKFLKLLAVGSMFFSGAAAIGQIRFDRFPVYSDLVFAALLPVGFYAIFWVLAILMPITVKAEGIKCYNTQSRYKEVLWSEIKSVYLMMLCGLPYACVEAESLSSPLTVPLYLENMQDFRDTVNEYAGIRNPLSEFLRKET
jgi:hypothetical protein